MKLSDQDIQTLQNTISTSANAAERTEALRQLAAYGEAKMAEEALDLAAVPRQQVVDVLGQATGRFIHNYNELNGLNFVAVIHRHPIGRGQPFIYFARTKGTQETLRLIRTIEALNWEMIGFFNMPSQEVVEVFAPVDSPGENASDDNFKGPFNFQ